MSLRFCLIVVALVGCTKIVPPTLPPVAPQAPQPPTNAATPALPLETPKEPAKAESRLTLVNYGKVPLGATDADAFAAFGPPTANSVVGPDTVKTWNDDTTHWVQVTLRDGRIVARNHGGLDPELGGRLTVANFDKLRLGMTPLQTRAALGLPTSEATEEGALLLDSAQPMKDDEPGKAIGATFRTGKLESRTARLLEPPDPAKRTAANWGRVVAGMPAAQLRTLLGPPARVAQDAERTTWEWDHGKQAAQVTLKDGKVTAKEPEGL